MKRSRRRLKHNGTSHMAPTAMRVVKLLIKKEVKTQGMIKLSIKVKAKTQRIIRFKSYQGTQTKISTFKINCKSHLINR